MVDFCSSRHGLVAGYLNNSELPGNTSGNCQSDKKFKNGIVNSEL